MKDRNPRRTQTERDICRAEFLVALVHGTTRDESVEALRHRAAATGVSRHAAALAVLSTGPTDDLLLADLPSPRPRLELLHGSRPSVADDAATGTRT